MVDNWGLATEETMDYKRREGRRKRNTEEVRRCEAEEGEEERKKDWLESETKAWKDGRRSEVTREEEEKWRILVFSKRPKSRQEEEG